MNHNNITTPPVLGDQDCYLLDELLDSRINEQGQTEYLVKWNNDKFEPSWEPIENINPSLIQRLGSELLPPQANSNPYPRFTSFIDTFYTYASQTLDFNADGQEVLRAIAGINILNDLRNDDDFKEANRAINGFDFVAPLLILQGQSFLRSYLLPKIQKGS